MSLRSTASPFTGQVSHRTVKLVYWGPGRGGKTTNLTSLHARLRPELKGNLVMLDAVGERTIYFDCLPLELTSGGMHTHLRLYTVPGQKRFSRTRRLVLRGVDGLVFVWDSRRRRRKENLYSLLEARHAVESLGLDWNRFPCVIQFNKQDHHEAEPTEVLEGVLDSWGDRSPRIRAVALEGKNVVETLGKITHLVFKGLRRSGEVGSSPAR